MDSQEKIVIYSQAVFSASEVAVKLAKIAIPMSNEEARSILRIQQDVNDIQRELGELIRNASQE